MQGVVPRPDVAPILKSRFVALASDADDPEEEVLRLAHNLEDAMMLPFVIFADADGRFLQGSSGFVSPAAFKTALEKLATKPR